MNSVFYRGTGRNLQDPSELKAGEIVRNNEICEPQFLSSRKTNGLSIFVDGDQGSGAIDRSNAVGDTADTATGYQIVIDTLTYIKKQLTEQKFYTVAPADYIPVVVGDGAFSADILTNRTYELADDFSSGNLRTGASNARIAAILSASALFLCSSSSNNLLLSTTFLLLSSNSALNLFSSLSYLRNNDF